MKKNSILYRFLSMFILLTFVSTVMIVPIGAPRAHAEKKDISYENMLSGMSTAEDLAAVAGICVITPAIKTGISYVSTIASFGLSKVFGGGEADAAAHFAGLPETVVPGVADVATGVAATDATGKGDAALGSGAGALAVAGKEITTAQGVAGGAAVAGTAAIAASVPAYDPIASIQRGAIATELAAIQATQVAVAGINATQKKTDSAASGIVDCLVYQAGQKMLNQLTNNIVRWIQGGFEGQPSYTVNTHEMFLELADMVAGDFARDLRGLAMCDFRVNFKNDLANTVELSSKRKYKFNGKAKCPFPETFNLNSSDFYKGVNKFSWGAMEYAMQENGNPFGIALLTGEELAARSSENKDVRKQELSWSNGFTNMVDTRFEKCNYPEDTDIPHLVVLWEAEKESPGMLTEDEKAELGGITQATVSAWQKRYCPTTTPGKQIGDLLSKTTGVDMDRLGMVDNINKIVAALIDQVTKEAAMGIFCAVDGNDDAEEPGCGKNPLPTNHVTVEDKTAETIAMENAALKPYFDAWQAEIKKEKDAKANLAKWEEQLLAAEMAIPMVQSDINDLNAIIEAEQAIIAAAPFKIAYAQAAYDAASSPEQSVARQQELQAAQAEVDTALATKKTAEYDAMIADKNYYAALMTEVDAGVIAGLKQAMDDANAVLAQAKATLSLANDRLYAAQHPAYVAPSQ